MSAPTLTRPVVSLLKTSVRSYTPGDVVEYCGPDMFSFPVGTLGMFRMMDDSETSAEFPYLVDFPIKGVGIGTMCMMATDIRPAR